jgi:ABC-type Fe3+/spermidine/putrescine transport system ATPase subunit
MTIELWKIAKSYGPTPVVHDVTLTTAPAEFLALLGPSGCGKSTTLRIIAGLEAADRGFVRVDGRDMTGLAANHRPVNMVFQSYALFPHLTVWDNVAYGLRRDGMIGRELALRVDEGLALVRLGALAGRYPPDLSGGQQQRVALARALVKRPKALLLDEPLGALDPTLRLHMQRELKRIQADLGITFVYVAHHQDEAFGLADRVAVMNGGRIVQLDTAEAVYRRPVDGFVAGFIGRINRLLTGAQAAGGAMDFGADGMIGLCWNNGGEASMTVGIRPEALRIAPPQPGQSWLAGTVAEVIFRGPVLEIEVDTPHCGRVLATSFQTHQPMPARGDRIILSFDAGDLIRYPEVTHAA